MKVVFNTEDRQSSTTLVTKAYVDNRGFYSLQKEPARSNNSGESRWDYWDSELLSGSGFSQPSKSATQSGSTETETLPPIGIHHACSEVSSSNYGANSYGVATFTGHDNFGVISSTRKALESEKSCKKSFC